MAVDRVKAMWAWVAEGPGESERLLGFAHGGDVSPLVRPSRAAADSFREVVQGFADRQGETVRLVKFTARRNVGSVRPNRGANANGRHSR